MSASDTLTRLDVLRSQIVIRLDAFARANICRELLPTLISVLMLGPQENQHPDITQLFDWLSDPERSVDEFLFLMGPMELLVIKNVERRLHSLDIYNEDIAHSAYLCLVAAESLAVHSPVLKGPWEQVAWFVLAYSDSYSADDYGLASDRLSAWLICVIDDSELCPNPRLRIEFMNLLLRMVNINEQNRGLALQSVMSASSNLNMEHEKECLYGMNPSTVGLIMVMFQTGTYMLDFDERLSEKLQDVKNSRLSAILNDVSYAIRIDSNRYTHPMELYGLTALLQTTAGYARLKCKTLQEDLYLLSHRDSLQEISLTLRRLVSIFLKSCHTPQLIDVTALCVMDVLELLLLSTAEHGHWLYSALRDCEDLLNLLSSVGNFEIWLLEPNHMECTSSIIHKILINYFRRLNNIRSKIENSDLVDFSLKDHYPIMYNLVTCYESILGDRWRHLL